MNPVGDLQIPAEAISNQLERMESAPAICVILVPIVLFSVAMMGISLAAQHQGLGLFVLLCPSVLLLVGLVGLLVNTVRFRKSCLAKPGWLGVFVRFGAYGISMLLAVLLLVVAGVWSLTKVCTDLRWGVFDWMHWGGLMLVAVVTFFFLRGIRGLHRRAEGEMETLQREVAVQIARETIRRQLDRQMYQGGRV